MTREHAPPERSSSAEAGDLRLLALDAEDLAVVSCNLQDAVVRAADLAFLPRQRRFALLASRFDWVAAEAGRMERCRAGLHFDNVVKVSSTGIRRDDREAVLNLLSVAFEEGEAPAGTVVLTFSGGAGIRLEVECVDAQLRDVGPRWAARHKPGHAIDDAPSAG
jgi:enamine deaminase RidA (YjgF/YER057c/UK114 family)